MYPIHSVTKMKTDFVYSTALGLSQEIHQARMGQDPCSQGTCVLVE